MLLSPVGSSTSHNPIALAAAEAARHAELAAQIVQYAIAFWLYLIGLRRLNASTAALFLTLIPVFGLGGAVIFLG